MTDDLRAFGGIFFQYITVAVHNPNDRLRFYVHTAVGQHTVRRCHIERDDTLRQTAQGGGQVLIIVVAFEDEGADAHVFCVGEDIVHADFLRDFNGRHIDGIHQGMAQRHFTAECPAVVLRTPTGNRDRRVVDDRARGHTFFHGTDVDKGFKCRTRLTYRLGGAIEMVRAASADHR